MARPRQQSDWNHGLSDAVRAAAASGLSDALLTIAAASDAEVPVDSGTLKSSRSTSRIDLVELRGAVTYSAPYAAIVHEDLTARHERGSAKFLERAMTTHREDALDSIAAKMRRALR